MIEAYKTHQQTLTVNGKQIRITIPAGIEHGQTIKIPGHGGPGINGGPNGDLYISFIIINHPTFKRMGDHIHLAVDIDLYTAILGGDITIDTLDGQVKLKVSPETQNGTKVKLKGKGFPIYKKEGQFGDMYVTYNVKIPTHLTDQQRALFTELSNSKNETIAGISSKVLKEVRYHFVHARDWCYRLGLKENGLIEIISIEQLDYISTDDLPILEKWSRLYVELGINVEGIETIHHLLERIGDLQQEVTVLRNRLGQFEE